MNSANNLALASGPTGYLLGKGSIPQIMYALVLCTILYIILMSLEVVYTNVRQMSSTRVDIMPYRASADTKMIEIEQNPSNKKHMMLPMSDNERFGTEFSYAFWIWVNPSSFRQETGFLHVFHKGHSIPYPLLCPGVFLHSNTNTLRVYVNGSNTWNSFVDVENIPVKKWVHVGIVAKGAAVEIYINGNIANKLSVEGGVIYQNFGNIYMFSQRKLTLNPISIPSLKGQNFQLYGTYNGMLASMVYFNYALSYTELQRLLDEGPSEKVERTNDMNPPYLQDQWWTSEYTRT